MKAAEADRFAFAKQLSEKPKVRETLKGFIEFEGPALLEVMIGQDACVYPVIGPGLTYKDMDGLFRLSPPPFDGFDWNELRG